jgi:hypothetical protein
VITLVACGGRVAEEDAGALFDAKTDVPSDAQVVDAGPKLDGAPPPECNDVPQVAQPVPYMQSSATTPPWAGASGKLPLGYFVLESMVVYDGIDGAMGNMRRTIRISAVDSDYQIDINQTYPIPPAQGMTYVGAENVPGQLTLDMTCPGSDAPTWLYRMEASKLHLRPLPNTDEIYAPVN